MNDTPDCPFGSCDCPKVDRIEQSIERMDATLATLTRLVYILAGAICVELGVIVW